MKRIIIDVEKRKEPKLFLDYKFRLELFVLTSIFSFSTEILELNPRADKQLFCKNYEFILNI